MKMFNLLIDDSLNDFLNEYNPEVIVVQECRFTKIESLKNCKHHLPNNYCINEIIDGRYLLTVIFCKNDIWKRVDRSSIGVENRGYVEIIEKNNKNKPWSVLGLHVPAGIEVEVLKKLKEAINNANCGIVCGDFNGSNKKITENFELIEKLGTENILMRGKKV